MSQKHNSISSHHTLIEAMTNIILKIINLSNLKASQKKDCLLSPLILQFISVLRHLVPETSLPHFKVNICNYDLVSCSFPLNTTNNGKCFGNLYSKITDESMGMLFAFICILQMSVPTV